MAPFWDFLNKTDAWSENDGIINWIFSHPLCLLLILFFIPVILTLLLNWAEEK